MAYEDYPDEGNFDSTDPATLAAQDQQNAEVIDLRKALHTSTPVDVIELINRGVAFQTQQAAVRIKPANQPPTP